MSLETFTGDSVPALLRQVRETLGPDAQVIRLDHAQGRYTLVASATPLAPDFRTVQPSARPPVPLSVRPSARPPVIALVGPTGAGKTTTIAKLAASRLGFAGQKVGLIGLDTYRAGAVEQLAAWAEAAKAPVMTAWTVEDAVRALAQFADCDVILVDAPGRGPARQDDLDAAREILAALDPDEVHLVLPAGRLWRLQASLLDSYRDFGITHLLATKLDECPDDWGVFELALQRNLPMRWIADGQQIRLDLRSAADRLAGASNRRPELRTGRVVA